MASTITKIGELIGSRISRGREDVSGGYFKGDLLEITTDALDMGSVPANDDAAVGVNLNITDATGVVIGDVVVGVCFNAATADPAQAAGLTFTAHIHDAANITIVALNGTAAAIDPGSGTYTILVAKNA